MKNLIKSSTVVVIMLFLLGCGNDDGLSQGNGNNSGSASSRDWSIPRGEVFDGGPGKDGIPALESPEFISASSATYLESNDLVLGYKNGSDIRAYPHAILDWHEIINDEVNGKALAITYCPLTGTGIGWSRIINGQETTFGVSGLLYNSNLLPYDRLTDSNWSQMRLDCVNGELLGDKIETFQIVETTWQTWLEMYDDTRVVSTNTGHSRNYNSFPYGDYRTNNNNIIFPFAPNDSRLPAKERVHGVIIDGRAKVYPLAEFINGPILIEDTFSENDLILVGDSQKNFVVSFKSVLSDGHKPVFTLLNGFQNEGLILSDEEGNLWNIFGEAVEGPRQGQSLTATESYIGYWFSWGAFYSTPEIYSENDGN
jgi:hypothetical protein